MKKINYKYVSLVLAFILIVTYSWHWNDIFFHQNNKMNMDMPMNMSMVDMMMDMLAGMKGRAGTELEKVFLQEMITHHQGAVNMARELLKDKTVRPELVKFANDIITNQSKEIEMQKEWLKKY